MELGDVHNVRREATQRDEEWCVVDDKFTVRDYDESYSESLRDMTILSSTALASCFGYPDMSFLFTSTTDGESERVHHRRSFSCHSVDSAEDVKVPSWNQRNAEPPSLPRRKPGTLGQRHGQVH